MLQQREATSAHVPAFPAAAPTTRAPLRVLHVGKFYPPHPGGMETVVSDLCQTLTERLQVEVVVANEGRSSRSEVLNGVAVTRLGRWGEILSTSIVPSLARFIRSGRWDVIHVHHPNPMGAVAFLMANPQAQLIVTYHSDIVRQRITGGLFHPILAKLLRRSARIHVASRELAESSTVLESFHDRTTVIPFGVREQRLLPLSEKQRAMSREFAAWGRGRLALFVGRVVYYKGLEYLIRAMADIDGRLLVIGEGDRLDSAKRLASQLALVERVRFLGEVDDATVAAALDACDLFVLPSVARSEAFGLVLLEAMAFSKPIISTALPTGVSFVNRDRETGFVVPPADAESLARAIGAILDDRELRARLAHGARARFEREFRVELSAERMLQLYSEVASPRVARPNSR